MNPSFRGGLSMLAVWSMVFSPLSAAEITPVWGLSFSGGQHFFEGRASSLGAVVNGHYTPVIKMSDRWSLFPTYTGQYQGTRDVQELAGGGTLFQDSMNHGLLLKSVHKMGPHWKIKPSLGARVELLRETSDEDWGQGLFDYQKYSGGIEAEYAAGSRLGGRLAYDYYQLRFPNYQSLESEAEPTLSRELAGSKVLDSGNHLVTLGLWTPLPAQGRMNLSTYMNLRGFGDQPVVGASGDLTGSDRHDNTLGFNMQTMYPFVIGEAVRGVGDLGLGYGMQTSNQNHYDARKTVFLPNYYNYAEWSLSPRVSASFGSSRWIASLGGSLQQRNYDQRPTQDGNGDYLSEKLKMTIVSTQLGFSYPISEHARIQFQSSLAWSSSNSDYDKVFKTNYKIANYGMGFTYEY